ncbi:putative glutathione-specific gamma-glutamylcyclotransferase 2 [Branchiostoma floridae]|uniref:glutathione-specific gamma-glutamylcyclotransferase n=1 Tax=Branchiostoma floridae TaxID=7739 RepID=A0A9J7LDQ4_BRAFL|nr:putative glutathione-specific gamma-glutamylcyclotransferase 2 [Branchiostoma floridae]
MMQHWLSADWPVSQICALIGQVTRSTRPLSPKTSGCRGKSSELFPRFSWWFLPTTLVFSDHKFVLLAIMAPSTSDPGGEQTDLWVFGYGSLTWNTCFPYTERVVGSVPGFSRRFWQANTVHRGTPDQAVTWGVAYQLKGRGQVTRALQHLTIREGALGGYTTEVARFIPADESLPSRDVLVYLSTEENPLYLGHSTQQETAVAIAAAVGRCGHNAEYLFKLSRFMRTSVPMVTDDYLFGLEAMVKNLLGQERAQELETSQTVADELSLTCRKDSVPMPCRFEYLPCRTVAECQRIETRPASESG